MFRKVNTFQNTGYFFIVISLTLFNLLPRLLNSKLIWRESIKGQKVRVNNNTVFPCREWGQDMGKRN